MDVTEILHCLVVIIHRDHRKICATSYSHFHDYPGFFRMYARFHELISGLSRICTNPVIPSPSLSSSPSSPSSSSSSFLACTTNSMQCHSQTTISRVVDSEPRPFLQLASSYRACGRHVMQGCHGSLVQSSGWDARSLKLTSKCIL